MDQYEHGVEEDPKFVKSNYVLVRMLDEYNKPSEEVKDDSLMSPVREDGSSDQRERLEMYKKPMYKLAGSMDLTPTVYKSPTIDDKVTS